jgi:hypothetical protein
MAERISPLARRVGRTHEQVDRTEVLLFKSEGFPDTSLDAVAVGRSGGMLAGNQDSETRLTRTTPLEIKRITARRASLPLAQQPLELSLAPQAAARVEAKSLKRRRYADYSARRRRPRARRLRSTLRPPAVRLRTRNPWRRARRVLEGW